MPALRTAFGSVLMLLLAGCASTASDPSVTPNTESPFAAYEGFPGDYVLTDFARVLKPGPYEIGATEVHDLRSERDGVNIRVGLIRPIVPDGLRVPVILLPSDLNGNVEITKENLRDSYGRNIPIASLVENFVPHGYAVAVVPPRGWSGSGGCWEDSSPAQGDDLDQAVTWLGTQSWSSGNVGTVGLSYSGGTQYQIAARGNPYLKTIVPTSGVLDRFEGLVRNGTTHLTGSSIGRMNPLHAESAVNRPECAETNTRAATPWVETFATGERDQGGYIAALNHRPGIEANYNGSILIVVGLRDAAVLPHIFYPWINTLDERIVVKQMIGQWTHVVPDFGLARTDPAQPWDSYNNPTPRADWAELLLNWFDYWLKGDRSVSLGPRVEVADSAGQWRMEEAWPPGDLENMPLYLTSTRTLAAEPNGTEATFMLVPDPSWTLPSIYANDPRSCTACATFTWRVDEDVRFAGAPRLPLSITPSGPGGHVTAFLLKLNDQGNVVLSNAVIDLRFAAAEGGPQPVVPGQAMTARMQFEPVDVVLRAGDRLVLVIGQASPSPSSLNDPGRVPPNPAGAIAPTQGSISNPLSNPPVVLTVGGERSQLILETFTRDESVFFDPPGP